VRDVFGYRARLSVREIVALMGAHSLGRPSSDATQNSGFSPLPWVDGGPNTNDLGGNFLTNRYFSTIATVPWRKSTTVALSGQWTAGGQTPDRIMLDTDMALAIDQSTCTAQPGGGGGTGNAVSFGGGGPTAVANPTNNGNCIFNDPGGTTGPYAELQRYAAINNNNLWKSDFTKVMQKMTEFSYSNWTFSLTSTTLSEITSTTLCTGKSLDLEYPHLIPPHSHNPLHISP